jgi:hypothetical protein
VQKIKDAAQRTQQRYADGHDRPLGGYLGAMGVYASAVVGVGALARRLGRRPPPSITPWDVGLMALATNKYSRLLAKDPVTSPFRAPFTRFEGTSAPAELSEQVRGSAGQHAAGELLTCPFCIGQWVATALAAGLVLAPDLTRLVAATGTALFGSDVLQHAYAWLQQASEGD